MRVTQMSDGEASGAGIWTLCASVFEKNTRVEHVIVNSTLCYELLQDTRCSISLHTSKVF